MLLSLENYDELVQRIYGAALDPTRWPNVTGDIGQAIGGPYSQLITLLHGPPNGGFVFTNSIPQSAVERWASSVVGNDPVTQAVIDHGLFIQGVAVNGSELISQQVLKRSKFYEELWEPLGIEDVCAGFVFDSTDSRIIPTAISVYRQQRDEPFGNESKKLMRMLTGHLSRALGVMFHLRDRELRVASSLAALNLLPAGVILVNTRGHLEFCNRPAERMLRNADPICPIKTGDKDSIRLHRRLGRFETAFKRLLDNARLGPQDQAFATEPDHFSLALVLPNDAGKPSCVIHAAPLGRSESFEPSCSGILILYDLSAIERISSQSLSGLFGLTPAESRIALAVLNGGTAGDIASRLSVSENTVRTQIKAVYAKTGARRHTELLKLLLALASEMP